jgi:hypothetical protein
LNLPCSIESLPKEILPEEEYAAKGSRYDHQVAVFGRAIQVRALHLPPRLCAASVACSKLPCITLM